MNDYLQRVNSAPFYGIVAGGLGVITIMWFVFLIKNHRAGVRGGAGKKYLFYTHDTAADPPSLEYLGRRGRLTKTTKKP